MKQLYSILFVVAFSLNIGAQINYHLPKVLFVTTGADAGRGTISDGIVSALQSFNKNGVFVRLENRKILLEPKRLTAYDVMFIPTIAGYHDAGKKYGLTFMSDIELKNINDWIRNGGLLVTDVNIGRNNMDEKDRISDKKELNANNWILGKALGVTLREINTENWQVIDTGMRIFKYPILNKNHKHHWRLVPVVTEKNTEIWALWQTETKTYPAITLHRYGKGKVLLLPDFYMLHPIEDGGLTTDNELQKIYNLIYQKALPDRKYPIDILPWKNAHTTVYCQTFDDGGNLKQYRRIFDFVNRNHLPTVFFVTPNIEPNIKNELQKQKLISLQGHSYSHPDFRKLNYEQTYQEFFKNGTYWNKQFTGFRFPYVSNSFWGMYWLEQLGFVYDTSIAANNMDFVRGSVVPYNIPIFKDDYYLTLNLLEISQIYHSDWFFYQKSLKNEIYTQTQQQIDAQAFQTYLHQYFDQVVKPYNGVMVYLGHPMYAGYSEITLQPLQNLINYLKTQNVWFASVNEVAKRWNLLRDLRIRIVENNNYVNLKFDLPKRQILKAFSVVLPQKPVNIIAREPYQIKQVEGKYFLIMDIKSNTEVKLFF